MEIVTFQFQQELKSARLDDSYAILGRKKGKKPTTWLRIWEVSLPVNTPELPGHSAVQFLVG